MNQTVLLLGYCLTTEIENCRILWFFLTLTMHCLKLLVFYYCTYCYILILFLLSLPRICLLITDYFFTQLAYTEHVYKKYIQIIHHRTCGALWPHHVTMLTFSQFYSKYSPFAGTHFSCLLTHLKYIWENQSWESSKSFLNRTFKVC